MYTLYRLNADELDAGFVASLKHLFPHKTIEIAVCEADSAEADETAHLLADPANRARLLEAIKHVHQQRDLASVRPDVMGLKGAFVVPPGDLTEDLEAARRALAKGAAL